MSLTAQLHRELANAPTARPCCRKAEAAVAYRLVGRLDAHAGGPVLVAVLDDLAAAERLRAHAWEVLGQRTSLSLDEPTAAWVVAAPAGEPSRRLASQVGFVDRVGRRTVGLPSIATGARPCDCASAWRAALACAGVLGSTPRSVDLSLPCPTPEVAMALGAAARRLGVSVRSREVRGVLVVTMRDEDLARMLDQVGAPATLAAWQERRDQVRSPADPGRRLANFDDANARRAQEAAALIAARCARALEILGDDCPEHLRQAGELRQQFPEDTLDQLGRRPDPPLSKDAIAGRLRRLMGLADKHAAERGIPDTCGEAGAGLSA